MYVLVERLILTASLTTDCRFLFARWCCSSTCTLRGPPANILLSNMLACFRSLQIVRLVDGGGQEEVLFMVIITGLMILQ